MHHIEPEFIGRVVGQRTGDHVIRGEQARRSGISIVDTALGGIADIQQAPGSAADRSVDYSSMSTEKTTAIVLRTVEFSETSLVVTLFTREFGKIGALAKGARRPKNPFSVRLGY